MKTPAEYQRIRRARLKAQGLCMFCGAAVPPGTIFLACTDCRRRNQRMTAQWRSRNRMNGLTGEGLPRVKPQYTEEQRKEMKRLWTHKTRHRYLALGLTTQGKPRKDRRLWDGMNVTAALTDRERAYRQFRITLPAAARVPSWESIQSGNGAHPANDSNP